MKCGSVRSNPPPHPPPLLPSLAPIHPTSSPSHRTEFILLTERKKTKNKQTNKQRRTKRHETTGDLLRHHPVLHQVRLVPHTLRFRESPHGVHCHTQERRRGVRIVRVRVHRLRLDAPVGHRHIRRVEPDHHDQRNDGERRRRDAGDDELRIPLPPPIVVLLHPSGDTEHHPRDRRRDRRRVVVLPGGRDRVLLRRYAREHGQGLDH